MFTRDDVIDVIAIVSGVGAIGKITVKSSGAEISRRNLKLLDMSARSIDMTIWGEQAENWNPDGSPVVAVRVSNHLVFFMPRTPSQRSVTLIARFFSQRRELKFPTSMARA